MKWTGSMVTCYILTKSLAIWGRGAELWEAVGGESWHTRSRVDIAVAGPSSVIR